MVPGIKSPLLFQRNKSLSPRKEGAGQPKADNDAAAAEVPPLELPATAAPQHAIRDPAKASAPGDARPSRHQQQTGHPDPTKVGGETSSPATQSLNLDEHRAGFTERLQRRLSKQRDPEAAQRARARKRDQVKMVGHHIHTAFKTWFKDDHVESDGTPLLPAPLSKKYSVLPQVLGQGSFAIVKAVVERATGTERALKIIAKKPLKDSNEKMLKEEIAILGKVEHPNIIKMWDLYETKDAVFIVTDLCRGGELFDRLVEKVHYTELDARHIVHQLIEGVEYLHSMDIIHRDLKPENILLRDTSEPSQIVISDFGLSRFIPEEGLLMTACGSPQYVAPEVLLGKGYGPPVDIWSCGVIAYCLLAGYTPFYGEDQPALFQQILGMKVEFEPEYWSDVSDTAKDFILHCLCPAERRMTPKQALSHAWLKDLPALHDDTPEQHRGKCLKDCAKRHKSSRDKLGRAVNAVSAVAYLEKLAHLRKEQADQHGLNPDSFHRLLRAATHVSSQSKQALVVDGVDGGAEGAVASDSAKTLTPSGSQNDAAAADAGRRANDSGMQLDLVIMPVFMPEEWDDIGASAKSSAARRRSLANGERTAARTNPSSPSARLAAASGGESGVDASARSNAGQPPNGVHNASLEKLMSEAMAPHSPTRSSSTSSEATAKSGGSGRHRRPRAAPSRRPTDKDSTLDALLDQYRSNELPASMRTDLSAPPQVPEGMSLAKAWKYVPLLVNSGISIGAAIASHAIYGPPKKSWGIEMSIFTRIMRDSTRYTEFATIAGLQGFFELSSLLPVPKDGLITPVTFRVKKRALRGILVELDAAEDGTRELTGEWVVGRQTWKRLQSEWRHGKAKDKERVILYIHGGAYFVMSAVTHRPLTIALSKYTECRVFGINYRLAPGCRFPGQLHDVVSAWFRLVDDLGIPPNNIVLGADSAGGGLAMALMFYLRDHKYELPSGAILFSPWVDLTISCDSWETNSKFDYLPLPPSGNHMDPVRAYLGDKIGEHITHPYASPLFGDMRGLPPLLIQCGDAEVLRDENTLLAHKAAKAGVAVRHELYEDCVHVFQAFLFLEASRKSLQSARHFVRTALDRHGRRRAEPREGSRRKVDQEMRHGMENERGERVEPRTGEREGSYKNDRGESDDELERRGDTYVRGDEPWEEDGTAAAATTAEAGPSAKKAARPPAVGAKGKEEMEEDKTARPRQRVESAPADVAALGGGPKPPSKRQPSAGVPAPAPPPRMTTISLSQARDRAQAAVRAQESGQAPRLSRFHDPVQPLAPRLRRSASNVAVDDLLRSYREDPGSLHTHVYTSNE